MKEKDLTQGGSLGAGKDSSIQLSSETLTAGRSQVRQVTLVGNPKSMGCLMDGGALPDGQRSLCNVPQEGKEPAMGSRNL